MFRMMECAEFIQPLCYVISGLILFLFLQIKNVVSETCYAFLNGNYIAYTHVLFIVLSHKKLTRHKLNRRKIQNCCILR